MFLYFSFLQKIFSSLILEYRTSDFGTAPQELGLDFDWVILLHENILMYSIS